MVAYSPMWQEYVTVIIDMLHARYLPVCPNGLQMGEAATAATQALSMYGMKRFYR